MSTERVRLRGAVVLLAIWLTACATRTPPGAPSSPARAEAPDADGVLVALVDAGRAGSGAAWDDLAVRLTETDPAPDQLEALLRAADGSEERLLEALLGRARFLSRDVSDVLRRTGRAVGRSGRWTAWRAAIREVSGRECCMTRRFLAATLDGLADGLDDAGVSRQDEVETALRLSELAGHADPGVAAAAARVLGHFEVPSR